jgi:hypothetical protein
MNECNCFEQRLKCMNCHRDVDPRDYNPSEAWREPEQLELTIPEPEEVTEVGGFFNSRDIPAI